MISYNPKQKVIIFPPPDIFECYSSQFALTFRNGLMKKYRTKAYHKTELNMCMIKQGLMMLMQVLWNT